RQLAHNTIYQFAGKIIGTVLALIASAQLFRYLAPAAYGEFHIAFTFVQMTGVIADLGLYLIVLNDINRPDRDHHYVISQNFICRFYLNLIYLAGMALLALILPYEAAVRWGIFLMSFCNVFLWFSQIIQTVFQKRFTTYYAAIAEIIGRGALLLSTLLLIYFHASLLPLTLTVVIGNFVTFGLTWYFSRKYLTFSWKPDPVYIKEVLRRTWPVAVSIWFSLIYFKADTIILSLFRSTYEVGIYGMPYRILETLVTLPLMFMGLLMPLLSQAFTVGDQPRFKSYLQKGFDVLALMAVPLFFGALPLARQLVLLLAGKDFLQSVPLLQILMLGVVMMYLAALFGHAVVALGAQKAMIKYYLGVAGVMLVLYLVLIPRYSYWAAAWLTVVAETAVLLSTMAVVYARSKFFPSVAVLGKAVVSAIIMASVLYPIRHLTLFLTLPLGAIIYFGLMYLIGGVKKELVREIIR
ncbi:MAG TPA: hypothetical protein DEP98_01625, partial [Candidatus Jacksonbacteria bacterium]|nr:hypothetical protein [Candidatus Jacksonbacteria bacterium]